MKEGTRARGYEGTEGHCRLRPRALLQQLFPPVLTLLPSYFPTFLPALLLTLPACTALPTEAPPVADSTMVDVLLEMHLAQARAERYSDVSSELLRDILARHGLDEEQFDEAMRYYADHPQQYVSLYDDVLDRLNAERGSVEMEEE